MSRPGGPAFLILSLDMVVTIEYDNLALHSPSWCELQNPEHRLLIVGGCYVSEHPAPPPAPLRDPERPSVWTSSLAEILLGHPDATLSHTCQYQWNDSDQTNRTAPLPNAILL